MIPPSAELMILYRWRLRPGSEPQFIADWSTVTQALRKRCGSLGSRLHRGDDGLWYGYAQWPDAEVVERAFAFPVDEAASSRMRDAIVEDFVPVRLSAMADFLIPLS